jgi:hypothetical protein
MVMRQLFLYPKTAEKEQPPFNLHFFTFFVEYKTAVPPLDSIGQQKEQPHRWDNEILITKPNST